MENTTKTATEKDRINPERAAEFAKQVRQITGLEPGYEANRQKRKPLLKVKKGRFQMTLWGKEVIIAPRNPEDKAFKPERRLMVDRVCLQRSVYSFRTRSYERQQIWLSPDEIRDLSGVLDMFSEQMGECPTAFSIESEDIGQKKDEVSE